MKHWLLELQAAGVLNKLYCQVLRSQLAHHKKKQTTKKGSSQLVGDGLPRLLSGDDFYKKVVEFTQAQEQAKEEKRARAEACNERAEAMKQWSKRDEER